MRGPQSTTNGGTTNTVNNKHGPGIHGVTNGDDAAYDPAQDLNANATELLAPFYDDLIANTKLACREANGEDGPVSDDANDDRLELARAVNTAANVLTGASSFVASGLRFGTVGGSLAVTLSPGIYDHEGQKYHATEPMLSGFVVQVNGVDAGTGSAFTLLPSRDHYISIAPTTTLVGYTGAVYDSPQRRVSIQVTDVANGAAAPGHPAGHFIWSMLRTDATEVTTVYYRAGPRIISGTADNGWELVDPQSAWPAGAMIPIVSGADLGSSIAPSEYGGSAIEAASAGNFVGTAHVQRLHMRTHTLLVRRQDRATTFTNYTTTAGATTSNLTIFNLADLPSRSAIHFTVTVTAYSSLDQGYSRIISRMGGVNSVSAAALYGSDSYLATHDPDTIGCAATITISGSSVRVSCAGAGGHNLTWLVKVETLQLRAI